MKTISMIFRKMKPKIKVYLSFSERRLPRCVQFIDDYLKPAFNASNIDYYDFREHEQFHFLNEPAIYEEIDKNLAKSDIFVRFFDRGMEPNRIYPVDDLWDDVIINPFTFNESGIPDYTEYEVNASFEKFGFNNPYNRFQLVPYGIGDSPMVHITSIYFDPDGEGEDSTKRIINELTKGYHEQRYLESFWKRESK